MSELTREMFYIADPMCSWCYGFAPVIQGIHAQYQDRIKISLVTGGLRVGNEHRLTEELKATLADHWKHVEELTGQGFNYDFAVPEGFIYNTEPSCRASVVMRKHNGDEVFPFFDTLHRAFYAESRDLTDTEVLKELAESHELDGDTFLASFEDKETLRQTYEDFAFGHNLGIRGFPSIVLKDDRGLALLTSGYQNFEDLSPVIDDWLESGATSNAAKG